MRYAGRLRRRAEVTAGRQASRRVGKLDYLVEKHSYALELDSSMPGGCLMRTLDLTIRRNNGVGLLVGEPDP